MQDSSRHLRTAMSSTDLLSQIQQALAAKPDEASLPVFALLLALAFLASLWIAFLYQRFAGGKSAGTEIHRTFPLLAIAVTSIFICIQFSLPLSLGLLGALSIVRFRTPIKQPEEVGFILLVIAAAIACATFNLRFLLGLLVLATLALFVRGFLGGLFRATASGGSLLLTLGEEEYQEKSAAVMALVEQHLDRARLDSVTRHGGEVVLTLSFKSAPEAAVVALDRALRVLVTPRNSSILLPPAA